MEGYTIGLAVGLGAGTVIGIAIAAGAVLFVAGLVVFLVKWTA